MHIMNRDAHVNPRDLPTVLLANSAQIASVCESSKCGGFMRQGDGENIRNLPPARPFAGSALFRRTFNEGMALVEETARYLDGPGRAEARALSRKGALLYAGESMRVTTRMMQAASWLLVQRAVHEGEMEPQVASSHRYRLGSKEICLGAPSENSEELLPAALRDLLTRSESLYRRIARLDDVLFDREKGGAPGARGHWNRLEQAFGSET
jgi:regulator of CtrA degradation